MPPVFYNPDLQLLDGGTVSLYNRWNYGNLAAPYWRFYWNSAPGAWVHFGGRHYPLLPDTVMLIPPDTPFSTSCNGAPRQLCIHFLAAHPYAGVAPEIFTFPLTAELKQLVDDALALEVAADQRRYSMQLLRLALTALMALPDRALQLVAPDARMMAAMRRLQQERTPAGNPALARQAGMSVNAFLRLFRRHTGKSPQQYGRQCRIDQACLQLHYSGLDIKAIAAAAGFCDRYHFSRVFKKLRGVSPAEFRNQQQKLFGEKS